MLIDNTSLNYSSRPQLMLTDYCINKLPLSTLAIVIGTGNY